MTPKPKDGTIAILSALLVLVTALLAPLLAAMVSILVLAASCSYPRCSSQGEAATVVMLSVTLL